MLTYDIMRIERARYMNEFENYVKTMKEVIKQLEILDFNEFAQSESTENIEFCSEFFTQHNKLMRSYLKMERAISYPSNNQLVDAQKIFELKCENDIYTATLETLLPVRYDFSKNITSKDKSLALFNAETNFWKESFKISLAMASDVSVKKFDTLSVLFVHYYDGKCKKRDFDNFEYKYFIDTVLVNGGFLTDDNPKFLKTIYSVSEKTVDKSFTRIFWGKPNDILKIMQKESQL